MAVAVNLVPVTGQTLPLVSMGGSSILFTSSALGIILSVSRSVMPAEAGVDDKKHVEEKDENNSDEMKKEEEN
jgi:cell division protein FtsW